MAQARNPFKHDSSLWNLGICFYTLQQHEKALAAWREMPETPTEVFACLAASYAHLGMKDEAQRNMAEFLERSRHELAHYPGDDGAEWLAYWYKSFPYKNAEDFENLIDGLRKAGLTI
jgi:tetratricopeptide (TPR) repeat protein